MTEEPVPYLTQHDLEVLTTTENAQVKLINDDWHTFPEVIHQIIKATGCSIQKAEKCTNEVHYNGFSIVYSGQVESCLEVSAVLEEIDLTTEVVF